MLENVISELIRQQRPYFIAQGNPIKGTGDRYWLVFKHRDADNFLHNIVTFLGWNGKQVTHKLLCIDPKTAKVFEYSPRHSGNLPSTTLLRTGNLKAIENFLHLDSTTTNKELLAGSFLEVPKNRRKFSLPDELDKYNGLFVKCLERSTFYRRSTAYFDSGILKLYEEPLQHIIRAEGQIRLLMDWQGFTKTADIAKLEQLQDPECLDKFARTSLNEFLQGLSDSAFSGTEIMAELVRLDFLQIKLVKMARGKGIYHKKTGIFTDPFGNSILHEGSDNFTRAAHLQNAESVTFFYSSDELDARTIRESIEQFDKEWHKEDFSFDLTQEFLQQVLKEKQRRAQQQQPSIDSIAPDVFPAGETTAVEIKGQNLDKVETIEVEGDELISVAIASVQPDLITGTVTVDSDRPSRQIERFKVKTPTGTYDITPKKTASVTTKTTLPDWQEIVGFRDAIASILAGKHGKPQDFLYWLALQKPHLLRVSQSDVLDELVDRGILFEHQKSGAQHCLRVMQDFGVAVCADAVGLGKTRLAAAVAKLYRQEKPQAKIAIVAAKKLHANWEREMAEVGFNIGTDYELYNKNLMSRKGSNFQADFSRYGGADLAIVDEAHEGIRNYKNRVHQTCLSIRDSDRQAKRQRHFLLLTATPWNNRREDIYNILSPFLSRPEGFKDLEFPPEVARWFESRDIGVENFTDKTEVFRRTYQELFLQRTRKMLKEATPDLNLYAKRVAEWLPVVFEADTERALDKIFTQFETSLFIPSADPIRYLSGNNEQRSLLANQRRFFLQRAESSMYALSRTIENFGDRISQVKQRLQNVTPDADGLKEFLLVHYGFETEPKDRHLDFIDANEDGDEDYYEEETESEEDSDKADKRQKLSNAIDNATNALRDYPDRAKQIYDRIIDDCDRDLIQLVQIQKLLADEFVKDHKREQVTQKVRELVKEGRKVLLISTFSDTVIDYYRYMANQAEIAQKGIGMAIGSIKWYYSNKSDKPTKVSQNNVLKGTSQQNELKRLEIFRLFAPVATCREIGDRPKPEAEIAVLIGSETLSVGQNLQDADCIINIDLPWNPMILEQRIGRIDRPKQHPVENIYIYYANSENQLLRQASRLSNLNKKLVGDLAGKSNSIPSISSVEALGASVYGDTYFDDEILPGYIDFIRSLVKARRVEQGSLQEETYQKQETSRHLYTQNEILHGEELRKLVENLGEDYRANPIAIGRTNEAEEPTGLVALTLEYFGPNGEPIPEQTEIIYWNDRTQENDGYGRAIATAFKTPEVGAIPSVTQTVDSAQSLYQGLVSLKQQYQSELNKSDKLENISLNSERTSKIQKRVAAMTSLPSGMDRKIVKDTLKKLSQYAELKQVQKLLREFTDGEKSQLSDLQWIEELVRETQLLSLLSFDGIKPTTLKVSLSALLLRLK